MTRSRYVLDHGQHFYGVRETTTNLVVWRSAGASATSAAYLVTFLNSHAIDLPARAVRAMLVPFDSMLDAEPEPGERAS